MLPSIETSRGQKINPCFLSNVLYKPVILYRELNLFFCSAVCVDYSSLVYKFCVYCLPSHKPGLIVGPFLKSWEQRMPYECLESNLHITGIAINKLNIINIITICRTMASSNEKELKFKVSLKLFSPLQLFFFWVKSKGNYKSWKTIVNLYLIFAIKAVNLLFGLFHN